MFTLHQLLAVSGTFPREAVAMKFAVRSSVVFSAFLCGLAAAAQAAGPIECAARADFGSPATKNFGTFVSEYTTDGFPFVEGSTSRGSAIKSLRDQGAIEGSLGIFIQNDLAGCFNSASGKTLGTGERLP